MQQHTFNVSLEPCTPLWSLLLFLQHHRMIGVDCDSTVVADDMRQVEQEEMVWSCSFWSLICGTSCCFI